MKQVIKDCKNMMMKKVGIVCLFLLCILITMGALWGHDMVSLWMGPQDFHVLEEELLTKKSDADVKHEYVQTDVDMIIGSYAEYWKQDQSNHEVYYLMPIQDGTYFITIITDASYIPTFDEMETAFYNSIGTNEKEYPEALSIQGGFRLLNDEEKSYALDFFTGYDEAVTTIDDISNILSPYAIEINTIGTMSIEHLWTMFAIWCILLVVLLILAFLYYTNFFLRNLQKDIQKLSDVCREQMDDDYANAKEVYDTKFGNVMFYKKERFSIRIYAYESIIWIYKREVLDKNKRNIQVTIYDHEGKQHVIYQTALEKDAEKYLQLIFEHCHQAILGYQDYLYEIWKQNPQQLPEKVKELQSIQQKTQNKGKKKNIINDADLKEQSKQRKRKVIEDKKAKLKKKKIENEVEYKETDEKSKEKE